MNENRTNLQKSLLCFQMSNYPDVAGSIPLIFRTQTDFCTAIQTMRVTDN